MPTYNYRCQDCGHEFEIVQRMTDEPLKLCPSCDKEELKKIIGDSGGFRIYGRGVHKPTTRFES